MPLSPTNMWCASSVSMKRVVRDSGSSALSESDISCDLPSRSVNIANMKKSSQLSIGLVERLEHARLVAIAARSARASPRPRRGRRGRSRCAAGRPWPTGACPLRRSPGTGCAGRRGSGTTCPSMRCCSTLAGSVSPCSTISRFSGWRNSPGTSCHTGLPKKSPNPIVRSCTGVRQEDAPAVLGHLHVVVVTPARRRRRWSPCAGRRGGSAGSPAAPSRATTR